MKDDRYLTGTSTGRFAGYLGTLICFCAWLFGLSLFGYLTGNLELVRPVFFPGLALSLGMGLVFLIVSGLTARFLGQRHHSIGGIRTSLVFFFAGVLLLLLSRWTARLIEEQALAAGRMSSFGSQLQAPDLIALLLMATGMLLFSFSLLQVIKGKSS